MIVRPRVSAVIVNFNGGADLIECLRALRSQTHALAEVIVVDNSSSDLSLETALAMFPEITPVANSKNEGFAAGANKGATAATGDVLLFLNPDISIAPDCLHRICEALEQSPGVVGPAITLEADTSDLYGCTIDRLGYPTSLRSPGKPLYVPGSALATPRTLFESLGGFDGRYFMFVEDVDYCWRAILTGFNVIVCPQAQATHRGGRSAPGGYVRAGRFETTSFRFVLRERNSLAMLLKCAPVSWLVWLIPAYILKTGILVAGTLLVRRAHLAGGLIRALIWNFRQLPMTYSMRRRVVRTRDGEHAALRRIYRGWLAFEHLRQYGVPQVDSRE